MDMEEDAKNIMDGVKDKRKGTFGDRNRERRNGTTKSNKKEAGILWTCYAIRRIGKGNDVGMWRGKKEGEDRWTRYMKKLE